MASDKINAIVDAVSELSVLELSELVSAVEEKFGVSAAAAVAVAAPAADAGAAVEEKTEFDLVLSEVGANKIAVIKGFLWFVYCLNGCILKILWKSDTIILLWKTLNF